MKIKTDDIQQMAKSGRCPCCQQSVSGALQQHIATQAGETLPTAESYRGPHYPASVEARIQESRQRHGLSGVRLTEPESEEARERASNRIGRNMGVKTAEGLKVFRDGRRAFDPNHIPGAA